VWGCRGSLAAPGPETVRYGGNTSCLEVRRDDGSLIVIDAGTGIRGLGLSLANEEPSRIDILLSHLHLDHLEGLGFFSPIWDEHNEIHVWGPASESGSLRDRILTYFSPPLFPIHLHDIPARVEFHDAPPEPWELGSVSISAALVEHPGPTLGYRLDEGGHVLTYISDHEPAKGVDLAAMEPEKVSGYGLALGADYLLHDSQYTEDEYPKRVGWGHSSIADTVLFAHMTKVDRLVMFHHDPLHSDLALEQLLLRARELWGSERDGLVVCAWEGMEFDVG